jgi:hypothetical protein
MNPFGTEYNHQVIVQTFAPPTLSIRRPNK